MGTVLGKLSWSDDSVHQLTKLKLIDPALGLASRRRVFLCAVASGVTCLTLYNALIA